MESHKFPQQARAVLLTVAALLAAAAIFAASASAKSWTASWGTGMQLPEESSFQGPSWSAAGFANQTVRQVVRLSIGGQDLRIRLSNVYGTSSLHVAGATIAEAGDGGALAGPVKSLTFGHSPSTTIPAGRQGLSDPVRLPTSALEHVAVTLYLDRPTGPATFHEFGLTTTFRASGDHRFDADGSAFTETTHSWFYLSAVDVARPGPARGSVVTFGDSLTDGFFTSPNTDNRYPDHLAERLLAAGEELGVVNTGIGGNRLLRNSPCFGESGLARFRRDVLERAGVRTVVFQEGINDLAAWNSTCVPNPGVTARALIKGYRIAIRAAHSRGIEILGGTLMPMKGSLAYSEQGEVVRQAVNNWIRTSGAFDGVVDFDQAMQDPAEPLQLNPVYNAGDWLHPNDAGAEAMAQAIDLSALGGAVNKGWR